MLNMKALATALTVATLAVSPVIVRPALAQQAPVTTEVSESELDAFVVALKDVIVIEEQYGERLQQVSDEAERQNIMSEAQTEMAQAVEATPDIDINRYVEIMQLAQADPDLQAQLMAKLEQ